MASRYRMAMVRYVWVLCIWGVCGCASTPPGLSPAPQSAVTTIPSIPGFYHIVAAKETLWGIAKNYGVDMEEIVRINKIPDAVSLNVGQKLFIPRHDETPARTSSVAAQEDFIWPLEGRVVCRFGQTVHTMVNKGLNIKPTRASDVVAARSGKVVFCADSFLSYGKTIIVDHGDGFMTVYARNAEIFVKTGDAVQKGQRIGRAGSSGRDTDVYLHFEIRKGSVPKNPYFYLPE